MSSPLGYRVQVAPRAERQLRRLAKEAQQRLTASMRALANDPRPPGAARLANVERLYRIRVGDYRIIYVVRNDILLVLVVQVGHRRDVYRRMPG